MEISKVFATYIVILCQLSLLIMQHDPTTIELTGAAYATDAGRLGDWEVVRRYPSRPTVL